MRLIAAAALLVALSPLPAAATPDEDMVGPYRMKLGPSEAEHDRWAFWIAPIRGGVYSCVAKVSGGVASEPLCERETGQVRERRQGWLITAVDVFWVPVDLSVLNLGGGLRWRAEKDVSWSAAPLYE